MTMITGKDLKKILLENHNNDDDDDDDGFSAMDKLNESLLLFGWGEQKKKESRM
jgi:hypothetical protein